VGAFGVSTEREPKLASENLEPLVGASKSEVIASLAVPDQELFEPGKTYLVYVEMVDGAARMAVGIVPFPTWGELERCSMLELDEKQIAQQYKVSPPVFAAMGTPSGIDATVPENCLLNFWSDEKYQALVANVMATKADQIHESGRSCADAIRRGEEGCDAKSLWYEAWGVNRQKAWLSNCLAAHLGHPPARSTVGKYFRWGFQPVSKDLTTAYVWYILAEQDGVPEAAYMQHLIKPEMTPAQIAEAERLAAEWQPNPAECEAYEVAGE
jgi:hypothetical protein